jgi:hypothetical protein
MLFHISNVVFMVAGCWAEISLCFFFFQKASTLKHMLLHNYINVNAAIAVILLSQKSLNGLQELRMH